ncbi:hypothetical protein N7512_002840 [Penicillium capsulatum]|nr:hypothetical protein N7512_002840 [Penicillium capsulatum]
MIEALCGHLSEKPSLYLDEMAVFLWDEFQTIIPRTSALKSKMRTYETNTYTSYHLVYIDKSGYNKQAGVKLVYRPPYSPDLNLIKEFLAELKSFIRRVWDYYERDPSRGFDVSLERCINVAGVKEEHAWGHFRHAGQEINFATYEIYLRSVVAHLQKRSTELTYKEILLEKVSTLASVFNSYIAPL